MLAFFLLNMKITTSLHALINHARIYQLIHFGVQLIKTTKVLEFVEIVVLKVSDTLTTVICKCNLCLLVCRLSSGSACNIYGTNNCSSSICNCKLEYKGDLCEKCNWREFSFMSSQRIGKTIDTINGYGVKCKTGILHCFEI